MAVGIYRSSSSGVAGCRKSEDGGRDRSARPAASRSASRKLPERQTRRVPQGHPDHHRGGGEDKHEEDDQLLVLYGLPILTLPACSKHDRGYTRRYSPRSCCDRPPSSLLQPVPTRRSNALAHTA